MAVNIVNKVLGEVRLRRALVSVSDKTGLEAFVPALLKACPDVEFWSTGGTHAALAGMLGGEKRRLHSISDYTGQPEMQGGLVKTLDFKVYLGLLSENFNKAHAADLERTGSVMFDLVVVNLYPFAATVSKPGATPEQARANIDIGGPCMIRASAKNFHRVAVVVDPADYGPLAEKLAARGGALSLADRFDLCRKAFRHTAAYDAAIDRYLSERTTGEVEGCYEIA